MSVATRSVAVGFVVIVACFGGARAQAPPPQPVMPSAPSLGAAPGSGGTGPSYDRKGRRDPFEPVNVVDAAMASPTVASARLKGIVRSQTPRALVETSDGLGYILKVGDALGEGRLVEIGADSVVFSVPARPGSTTTRIVLRLPDD